MNLLSSLLSCGRRSWSRVFALIDPALLVLLALMLICQQPQATAATLRQGVSAFSREDYVAAARIFTPYAERGNRDAQAYLGYLYLRGHGVPQNYTEAAQWFLRAAEQGHSAAQYMLGLLYDKGQGVPQDLVEAHKWLTLSTAGASRSAREYRGRLRDAVDTKMLRGEIAESRMRALQWAQRREGTTLPFGDAQ